MLFTLTQQGLSALTNAPGTGPTISISHFAVVANTTATYTPTGLETSLSDVTGSVGGTIYPTSNYYAILNYTVTSPSAGQANCIWTCTLDDSIGTYTMQVVGLFASVSGGSPILFALAQIPGGQSKTASTSNTAGNTVEILAKLNLSIQQANTITYTTQTGSGGSLLEAGTFTNVYPPSSAPANQYRVTEINEFKESPVLTETSYAPDGTHSVWASREYPIVEIGNGTISSATTYVVSSNDIGTAGDKLLTTTTTTWASTHTYAYGAYVVPTVSTGYFYMCNNPNGGTTSGTEPSWPVALGGTVTDGTVTWLCVANTSYTPVIRGRYVFQLLTTGVAGLSPGLMREVIAIGSNAFVVLNPFTTPPGTSDTYTIYRAFSPNALPRFILERQLLVAPLAYFNQSN